MPTTGERFERVVEIMAQLRAPGGCPWDREQTIDSLKPFILEETYEVLEAIDQHDHQGLCEELGDHCSIGTGRGRATETYRGQFQTFRAEAEGIQFLGRFEHQVAVKQVRGVVKRELLGVEVPSNTRELRAG